MMGVRYCIIEGYVLVVPEEHAIANDLTGASQRLTERAEVTV
jgi:hypothetical protein